MMPGRIRNCIAGTALLMSFYGITFLVHGFGA